MGAYLSCEEAQTAEPAAATGQISRTSPQPDLGSTVDSLTAKYGKPVKVEKAWCGGTAYGFRPTKMTYVYAIETNGVVGDVTYFDFNKPELTQEDSVRLFRSQFRDYRLAIHLGRQRVQKGTWPGKGKALDTHAMDRSFRRYASRGEVLYQQSKG